MTKLHSKAFFDIQTIVFLQSNGKIIGPQKILCPESRVEIRKNQSAHH